MASREERMQQRLRGAQRRQVKDVDFGIIFPAATALPETTAPDQPSPPPVEEAQARLASTQRTPAIRLLPQAKAATSRSLSSIITHSANDANISAKRRKLDTDVTQSTSLRLTRSSQKAPRVDTHASPDDSLQKDTSVLETSGGSVRQALTSKVTPEAEIIAPTNLRSKTPNTLRTADEVTESPYDAPGSGQRIRADTSNSVLASSILQSIQHVSSFVETPLVQKKRKRKPEEQHLTPNLPQIESSRARGTIVEDDDLDELSPEQPTIRSRKSQVQVEAHSPELLESSIVNEPEEQEAAEVIDDEGAAIALKKLRGRRISENLREESPGLTLNPETRKPPDGRKQKRGLGAKPSPVMQGPPKQLAAKVKPEVSKFNKRLKVRIGSPIPITIHRLTQPLLFAEEEESDTAILNMGISHTRRKGVNTIDVLSQVCQEMVDSAMDTLEEGSANCDDAALRREYKTKWNAVSSFGRELQTRLLEHTVNLDNAYSLGRRLKDEQRRKLALREEILRVRAEREQVALQMDEVRIRHEREKTAALRRDTLNTAVNDIQLAVDLGKITTDANESNDLTGIELLLKRVASEISSIGSSGGLLRRIQDFNAFLERAAQALESKKV